jgi:hypothetical protein
MKGPSKLSPNSFQIRNLEGNVWTFEQIDKLRQSTIRLSKFSNNQIFESSKSPPNWFQMSKPVVFVYIWKKSNLSGQAGYSSEFCFYLDLSQISTFPICKAVKPWLSMRKVMDTADSQRNLQLFKNSPCNFPAQEGSKHLNGSYDSWLTKHITIL